jgi:hypothetical protein
VSFHIGNLVLEKAARVLIKSCVLLFCIDTVYGEFWDSTYFMRIFERRLPLIFHEGLLLLRSFVTESGFHGALEVWWKVSDAEGSQQAGKAHFELMIPGEEELQHLKGVD